MGIFEIVLFRNREEVLVILWSTRFVVCYVFKYECWWDRMYCQLSSSILSLSDFFFLDVSSTKQLTYFDSLFATNYLPILGKLLINSGDQPRGTKVESTFWKIQMESDS